LITNVNKTAPVTRCVFILLRTQPVDNHRYHPLNRAISVDRTLKNHLFILRESKLINIKAMSDLTIGTSY